MDHSTVNRWVIKYAPQLEETFRKRHKRPVGISWRMDETYIKVKGQWVYLYRAVDKEGNTVDFMLSEKRDEPTARAFFGVLSQKYFLAQYVVYNIAIDLLYLVVANIFATESLFRPQRIKYNSRVQ